MDRIDEGRTTDGRESQVRGVGGSEIAVHWREEDLYYPSAAFIGQANVSDPKILERFSEENFPECFKEYADLLDWDEYWHTTLDTSNPPFWRWFVGGRLTPPTTASTATSPSRATRPRFSTCPSRRRRAPRRSRTRSCTGGSTSFAALLQDFCGLKAGDRVTFHLPMIPELPVSMLACARLGVVHSEVFGGFSGAAAGDRVADSGSRILVTVDGYYRSGKIQDHKEKADEAIEAAMKLGQEVDKVLVFRATPVSTR